MLPIGSHSAEQCSLVCSNDSLSSGPGNASVSLGDNSQPLVDRHLVMDAFGVYSQRHIDMIQISYT